MAIDALLRDFDPDLAKQRRLDGLQSKILLQGVGRFAAVEKITQIAFRDLQEMPQLYLQTR